MRLPLRVRLLGHLRTALSGSVAELEPAAVPGARERSGRIQAGPLGRSVVLRHAREVATEETVVDADGVRLPARVYRPPQTSATPPPVIMNFHGGGYVQGDLDQSDWFCGRVSTLAGAVVISVDYRLAPEHPFPTPAGTATRRSPRSPPIPARGGSTPRACTSWATAPAAPSRPSRA